VFENTREKKAPTTQELSNHTLKAINKDRATRSAFQIWN